MSLRSLDLGEETCHLRSARGDRREALVARVVELALEHFKLRDQPLCEVGVDGVGKAWA